LAQHRIESSEISGGIMVAEAPPRRQAEALAREALGRAGAAKGFARQGFRLTPGQRCGDHDAARYLAAVNAMLRQFRQIAANE